MRQKRHYLLKVRINQIFNYPDFSIPILVRIIETLLFASLSLKILMLLMLIKQNYVNPTLQHHAYISYLCKMINMDLRLEDCTLMPISNEMRSAKYYCQNTFVRI